MSTFLSKKIFAVIVTVIFISSFTTNSSFAQNTELANNIDPTDHFFNLLIPQSEEDYIASLEFIEQNWQPGFMIFALEVYPYSRDLRTYDKLRELIKKTAKGVTSDNTQDWYFWLWNQSIEPAVGYDKFKADLFRSIDLKFEKYFADRADTARIRMDEIRWGGVRQDGIPPLRDPEMITPTEADYLEEDNIVFGIEINGDARAYPKRILAWHEMFTDTIGGVPIAGVYCTLCGTVIPYITEHEGVNYRLGTSGFLYRSNKLMYDQATQSLWSTTEGKPVLGPLVDQGIQLNYESVVTTTWGEWLKRHPDTTVLSLNTGHQRDYGEGVAYAEYFDTDQLMFNTPFEDNRLANKQEILALRFPAAPNQQLAIDTNFLNNNPVYTGKIGQQQFVVFTDMSGANRVYDPKGIEFESYDGNQTITDSSGKQWTLAEEWLEDTDKKRLNRLPYHRAFWFGWRAAFPETQLIQ